MNQKDTGRAVESSLDAHDEFQAAYGAWVTSADGLEQLRAEWTDLFQQLDGDAEALSFDAVYARWLQLPKPVQLAIAVVRNASGRLVGVAPFYIARSFGEDHHIRRLSFLAATLSDQAKTLIDPQFEEAVIQEIAKMLSNHRREWDCIDLSLPGLMPLLDYINAITSRPAVPVPVPK